MLPRAGVSLVALVVLLVVVGLSADALAYVDLGTGSYMLQLLTAGLFGILFSARSLLARLRAMVTHRKARGR